MNGKRRRGITQEGVRRGNRLIFASDDALSIKLLAQPLATPCVSPLLALSFMTAPGS